MSISGRDTRFHKSSSINGNIVSPLEDYWIRPSDWLALPTVSSTEQKFVGLFAVFNQISNYVNIVCGGGNYIIDWGDGSSPESVINGVVATHNYTYSSISSSTNSSRGYRQVIITVTPDTGQTITSIDFVNAVTGNQIASVGTVMPWLDMRMSFPSATGIGFSSSSNVLRLRMVENIEILSSNLSSMFYRFAECTSLVNVYVKSSAAVNDTRNCFLNCRNLTNVDFDFLIALGCDGSDMFNGCSKMRRSPALNFGTSGYFWTLQRHFNGCTLLQDVFPYPTSSTTNFGSMFNGCTSLKTAPWMVTTAATAMDSMFQNCSSLQTVPLYDTNGVSTMASMFNGCLVLETIPELDFSTLGTSNYTSIFANCYRLKAVPNNFAAQIPAPVNATGIFQNCFSLPVVPSFNTNNTTAISNLFVNCSSLRSIPNYNFANVTSGLTSFYSGGSLIECLATNINASITLNSGAMQESAMETVFNNLLRTTTSKTVSMTNNPGGRAVQTTTGTYTSGSPSFTVGTVANLAVGQWVTSTNLPSTKSVTFQGGADTVTLNSHGLANDKAVAFSVITTTTGISTYTTYYVVNATSNTFQLATTPGGAAIDLVSDGSGTILLVYKVLSIVSATITVDAPASTTGNASTVFRYLNSSLATFKGWTVSL